MRFIKSFYSVAILFCSCFLQVQAQQKNYSVANAHAHNDYNHPLPFYTAYEAGFGSMEADIFLQDGRLFVAHYAADITPQRTLQSLYLDPLQKTIQTNGGKIYADSLKNLLFLIDLKTPGEPTLEALLQLLQQYPTITACPTLKIVITGNRPVATKLLSYPPYLYFDGDLNQSYPAEALNRVALFSQEFRKYAVWKGEGPLADSMRTKIETAVNKAHGLKKPIRFWAAPDVPEAWRQLMNLNVDYINTDKISDLSAFLKKEGSVYSRPN